MQLGSNRFTSELFFCSNLGESLGIRLKLFSNVFIARFTLLVVEKKSYYKEKKLSEVKNKNVRDEWEKVVGKKTPKNSLPRENVYNNKNRKLTIKLSRAASLTTFRSTTRPRERERRRPAPLSHTCWLAVAPQPHHQYAHHSHSGLFPISDQ